MEIKSSGGLYGNFSVDTLGKSRPETRNAALANILEILKVTENRYSGIPTIYRECEKAGLPKPEFKVVRGDFTVIFKNNMYYNVEKPTIANMEDAILSFCTIPRSRNELLGLTGKSRYYTMTKWINPLIANGKLKMTLPDKPKSTHQKYYAVQ